MFFEKGFLFLAVLALLALAGQVYFFQNEMVNVEVGSVFRDCAKCPKMAVVPSGSFMMGFSSDEKDHFNAEGPQHRVHIAYPFAVGVYEVTFAEWDACVSDGGCNGYRPDDKGWGRSNRPVINVSWMDARFYVDWLSEKTGHKYSLLSESEWEYVARAGRRFIAGG